jgi:carbamoyl-phosphate synthase large subunit
MKRRVLVTATGGTLAPLNIRLMKQSRHAEVFVLGVDTRADAAGRYFADAFAQVPEGDAPGYVDAIVRLIQKHQIDIVLPWSDEEALALAGQRTQVEGGGAILACAPLATLQIMSDKFATYELMAKAGILMPSFVKVENQSALEAAVGRFARDFGEFAVKPVTARGNRGTIVVRTDITGAQPYLGSRELHMDIETFKRHHLAEMPLPAIVMERLHAPAYDIDVLAHAGKVLRAMPRRRLNPAGIPFMGGVLTPTKPLLDLADRITQALNLSWLYDYDLMTNGRGEAIPIEINPRPSGSIAAAILAGVPFYDDLIALANGQPISDVPLPGEVAVIPYMDCRVVPADQIV